ncbi:ida [Drosophila busckii]|uniref:Anaphase-promoting complex subunit 5 n=2 Tax=Drosophila busckii TaxID=30019 RepID=A0A0M4ER04_DROBS|nr:ida [Drosophila busckii]
MVPPRIETPTPHKIAVIILLKQYVKEKKSAMDTGITIRPHQRRMFCMLMLKLIQAPDMTYNELHIMLTTRPYKLDPLMLESFEKAMSEFCGSASIEALFDFADVHNIDILLNEEYGVYQFSTMGVYVRRVSVVLERFSFAEMMCMYRNICAYYERGIRALATGPRKPVAGGVLHRGESPPPPQVEKAAEGDAASKKENKTESAVCSAEYNTLSKWAPKQAKFFINTQSELLDTNESRALPPKELQRKVQQIIQDLPLSTTAYFLGYMNHLRVRDYHNALAALHRALDRSPVRLMSQKGYQYFCINVAVLHATFGHREEALAALRESIMLAQEHDDDRSLKLANTWHCLLRDELPLSYVQDNVLNISDNFTNLQQNYILALHFAVKLGTVAGCKPLRLFDLLQFSDILTNRNNYATHATDALALRSAVWSAYGRHELSALYAQLLLSAQDSFGNSGAAGFSSAMASSALRLQLQGEQALSRVFLHRAREQLPRMPNSECCMISQCHVTIQSGIYRCRWHDAFKACDQLYLLDPSDSMLQRATIYVAKREFYNARRLLDKLATKPELPFLLRTRVQVLLAYCSSLAGTRFSSEAVQFLLSVAEDMSHAQMDYELALVDMLLAQVLLTLGMRQKAYQTIKRCMDDIHINGSLYERAKTDFLFVRCLLAITDSEKQKEQLLKSLDILERAAGYFKKLCAHAKTMDVYVYIAVRFNEMGERMLRNKYAAEYRQYFTEHPIAAEYLGGL